MQSKYIRNFNCYSHCFQLYRFCSLCVFINNSKEDAHTIFRDAAALNMTETGFVWIVTEQALNANNTPDGVLGLQLVYANSEKEHIRVSTSFT